MGDKKHAVVIGAGIVGCVIAHELATDGWKVNIVERRNHIGGNMYDYWDEHGILVHKYGPHIFHTNSDRVYEFVAKRCRLRDFSLSCGTMIDGRCFRMPFDICTIEQIYGDRAGEYINHIKRAFGERESATVLEMLHSDDRFVREYAEYLFENDYRPYTAKQWGIDPSEIDPSVFSRVPVYFVKQESYFTDKYQAMPAHCYMELFQSLINLPGISVETEKDGLSSIKIKDKNCQYDGREEITVIYTGPIDELFGMRYGRLPYRSLRFEWFYEERESFQEKPVVAYPMAEGYTRITEYKKLPVQDVHGTSYAMECSVKYEADLGNEPYYPILTEDSQLLYRKYHELQQTIENLYCCGRLADYKYYNMDQAIERALDVAGEIRGEKDGK